ncbi:MAG TPA: hypothetical protein DGT21_09885 [Armatimonadetes bacterium]|nr:hypothetical protein [Armatimonadota bacterium]
MVRHAREDVPEAIGHHAEAQPLLERVDLLLEDDDSEALRHAREVGGGAVDGERLLADDEEVIG